jgi:hypothetical protein
MTCDRFKLLSSSYPVSLIDFVSLKFGRGIVSFFPWRCICTVPVTFHLNIFAMLRLLILRTSVLQLSPRDIANPSTPAPNTAPSVFEGTLVTLTLTSILPPAGNRTQKITQVHTTVVASGTAALSSTLTSTVSGIITTVATTSPTAAATPTSAATGSFPGTLALLYLILPILTGVFIVRP